MRHNRNPFRRGVGEGSSFIEHVGLAPGFKGLDVRLPGGFDLLGGVAGDDLLAKVIGAT